MPGIDWKKAAATLDQRSQHLGMQSDRNPAIRFNPVARAAAAAASIVCQQLAIVIRESIIDGSADLNDPARPKQDRYPHCGRIDEEQVRNGPWRE